MSLNEYELKKLLKEKGILVPKGIFLKKDTPLIEIHNILSKEGLSPPYVIKITAKGIIHKTELKGIELGVSERELFSKLEDFRKNFPGYDLLVEEMILDKGVEVIVGVINDEDFGLSIMIGMGGIFTEIVQDVSFRLFPIDEIEVYDMINELKLKKLLYGYRGIKPSIEGLFALILKLNDFIGEYKGRIKQLDLNPVLLTEKEAIVLDVKGEIQ